MAKVSMPQRGESVTEGTIGRWLKQPGEAVEKYEPLVEVTTDKVNAEIPSPFGGVLQEITAQEGETVHVGTQIAVIAVEGDGAAEPRGEAAPSAPAAAEVAPEPVTNQAGGEAAGPASAAATAEQAEAAAPTDATVTAAARAEPEFGSPTGGEGARGADGDGADTGGRRRFTPLVLRLAEQHGIPLEELGRMTGSGLGGRVSKKDVLTYIETRGAAPRPMPEPSAAPPPAAAAEPAPAPAVPPRPSPVAPQPAAMPQPAAGELVPLTPMRKAIAEHMVRSLATSPHAWTMVEVDMTALARYRAAKKDEFQRREGIPLSYVPFFIEAVVGALKEFPSLNASFVEGGIQLKREINIGVAVALEHQQGLIVPAIKGADEPHVV